ncbi:MAG: HlyD family efflux transporter periplasmic adaptor subunit [Candidatus Sedimenticola endophacoides]
MIIEAKLPIQDIGYVAVGQHAFIRLDSSDAMRFGNIDGEVVSISPDSFSDEEGNAYYRVRVAISNDHFISGKMRYRLYPGMLVTASIRTGQRSVLEYLLTPFVSSGADALRER